MTPPALDADLVLARLRAMRALLDDLDALPPISGSVLAQDRMLRPARPMIIGRSTGPAAWGCSDDLACDRRSGADWTTSGMA